MLDDKHGKDAYSVTNLGACGSTMQKRGDSPYWLRPQYTALVNAKWDIVIIMLGTNDAKDAGDHGPQNWFDNCGGSDHPSLENCSFATDYKAMIDLVKTLGTSASGPEIYIMTPPPLMQKFAYGMNQTAINSIYPELIPLIASANKPNVAGIIDVYSGMGGVENWKTQFPDKCDLNSDLGSCKLFCDSQHCDQCHPNDNGYHQLASVVEAGLQLKAETPRDAVQLELTV